MLRSGLASIAVLLGYQSVAHSLAETLRRQNPVRAHTLAMGDGRTTGLLAQRIFVRSPRATAQVVALARQALRQDPTVIPAVVTLGLVKQTAGDTLAAHRLLVYAQKLSRRDLQTHVWAIEDAVARNDVPSALQHYDLALRTSRDAPDLLFPVLAMAIDQPEVRSKLVTVMRRRPLWVAGFIGHAAGGNQDPSVTVQLFDDLRRAGLSISADASAAVVGRLFSLGRIDSAWRYYASYRTGADSRLVRNPGFTINVSSPTLFDWNIVNDTGISTSINSGLNFVVSSGMRGVLAQQVQYLPAGVYQLEGHSTEIDQPQTSWPYWTLACRDGRDLGQVAVPASSRLKGRFTGTFVVPLHCPVQTLAFVARSSDAIGGVTGRIDYVKLVAVK